MTLLKKPKCPICELGIRFKKVELQSSSPNPSSLSCTHKQAQYVCAGGYDVCELALHIYIAATNKGISSANTDNYRFALERYIEFVEFCLDNNLKGKLFAYCDKYGRISDRDRALLLGQAFTK